MRTTLNLVTALATILATFSEAAALGDFAPAEPLMCPAASRPAVVPAADVSRLTRTPRPNPVGAPGTTDADKDRRVG